MDEIERQKNRLYWRKWALEQMKIFIKLYDETKNKIKSQIYDFRLSSCVTHFNVKRNRIVHINIKPPEIDYKNSSSSFHFLA
jgi:hypothetical protein